MADDGISSDGGSRLLARDHCPPVTILNPSGASPFLLTGDHAGKFVPEPLEGLGLPAAERARHIAWDIGVAGLGERLSTLLDATFVAQPVSRLVIDCNRDPAASDAIPQVSDGTAVPGNAGLTAAARAARVAAVHAPYQEAIAAALATRPEAVLVALHSFTPQMAGVARPWAVGVLYGGGEERFARALLGRLRRRAGLVVGDNEPYAFDGTDHTVPRHAFAAGRRYVELEIRQDLLAADPAGWAALLAAELPATLAEAEGI